MVGSQTNYALYRNMQRSLRKLPTGLFVASALWRQSFWKAYIPALYEVRKDACIDRFLVPLYALFVICSSLHGGKKQITQRKNDQRHDEGICTDFIFLRFNLKEIQL